MAAPAHAPIARPPWRYSLKTRIAAWFGLLAAIIASGGGLLIHGVAERRAVAAAEASLDQELRRAAAETQALMRAVEVGAGMLALAHQAVGESESRALALLEASVMADPDLAGGLIALSPTHSPRPGEAWARYVARHGRGVRHEDLLAGGGGLADLPGFRDALASPLPQWSSPWFNHAAGGRWMVTLRRPLLAGDATVAGMVSLDVPINRFNAVLTPLRNDRRLRAILHKGPAAIGDSTWRSIATPPPAPGSFDRLLLSPPTVVVDGGRRHIRPISPGVRGSHVALGEGWGLLLLLDEDRVLEPLRQTTWRFVGGTLVAIALLALLGNALARGITRPMVHLGVAAQRLARDGFGMPTPLLVRRDEVGQLARVLDRADAALRQQVAHSLRMAQEQQKLDSELRLAHDLQQSMLPSATAVDVHEGHLDIHAVLKPAKSVGGDFYAFHPRDDGMLWFSIGDISDKGVPAALFMARTVAVLEATARSTDSPALMLARAAPRLAEGNERCMFATALCGLVDPHTGMFELASSGHELPFIVRADGRIELFEMETGAPLGIDPDAYGEGHAGMLAPGDCLFCFTDGVTEARDRRGELFGEARLREALKPGRTAEQVVADVIAAVEAFSAGAETADDVTVLAVSLVAPGKAASVPLRFPIWPSGLRTMNPAIDECLANHGMDAEGRSDVRLVLEELAANAIDHGGALECTVDFAVSERTITLKVVDDGKAFNPLDRPELELDAEDLDRPVGGLGLQLVRTMSLDAVYVRDGDRNTLTLVLPRNAPT